MAPDTADVSVVIPAYRAAGTIGRALAGVRAQTVRPREIIVIDDGSNDGTADAALAAAPAEIETKVIRQENQGAGAARNRGIAEASGEFIAFLDADDEWLPEKLERTLARMPGNVFVGHNGLIVDEAGREDVIDGAARFKMRADPWVGLYERGYVDTCTVVARRDAVLAAGGFDATLPNAQDFDLWLALAESADARFEVFDEVLSRYHIQSGSIMSRTWRRLDCCMEIARRYSPVLARRTGNPLGPLFFRILAVHYEAIQTLRRRGDWGGVVLAGIELPVQMLLALPYPWRKWTERPDFIDGESWPSPKKGAEAWALAWVAAAMAAFLIQFRDLFGPVMRLLGLT